MILGGWWGSIEVIPVENELTDDQKRSVRMYLDGLKRDIELKDEVGLQRGDTTE